MHYVRVESQLVPSLVVFQLIRGNASLLDKFSIRDGELKSVPVTLQRIGIYCDDNKDKIHSSTWCWR